MDDSSRYWSVRFNAHATRLGRCWARSIRLSDNKVLDPWIMDTLISQCGRNARAVAVHMKPQLVNFAAIGVLIDESCPEDTHRPGNDDRSSRVDLGCGQATHKARLRYFA